MDRSHNHPLAQPRRPVRDDERVTEPEPDWRQRKKAETRDRIRGCALRLFLEQGYDATTVEQIAAAAGVSHMTFFRYFPVKEDVVLSDSYDPLIARLLEQTPAAWPVLQRIRAALLQGLARVYETDRDTLLAQNKLIAATPALRDRLWADQIATQQLFLQALGGHALDSQALDSQALGGQALGGGERDRRPSLQTRVTIAACLAAASTAILAWVENDGTPELPELIDQAFEALAHPG
jgi:AcrR family transcriptional regulator